MSNLPDFLKLYQHYHERLDNGDRSQIKRAVAPDDLIGLPAFYHLIGNSAPQQLKQLARIAFFLPLIDGNKKEAESLGRQLSAKKISEKRLFHIIRSESPKDLIQLRRVLQQAKLKSINWERFANRLFFWNESSKKELMQEFYLQQPQQDRE